MKSGAALEKRDDQRNWAQLGIGSMGGKLQQLRLMQQEAEQLLAAGH
jgi:hypothetical protein